MIDLEKEEAKRNQCVIQDLRKRNQCVIQDLRRKERTAREQKKSLERASERQKLMLEKKQDEVLQTEQSLSYSGQRLSVIINEIK